MDNLIGHTLGRYRIVVTHDIGGVGKVYRARDERRRRDVLIRVLPSELAENDEWRTRFEHHIKMVADINHPNIHPIRDLVTAHGRTFIVTDPIDGRTIRQVLDTGRLTNREVINIGSQIASGIAAAHDAGVSFLGLDPSNVFITGDGAVTIGAFGFIHAGPLGEYFSPEQIRDGSVDQRSDLFGLGVLLYELLTGLSPFRRVTESDTKEAILSEDPPLVSANTSKVTPAFDGVIRRCLHKRPEDRFQSARNVGSKLQALVTVQEGKKKSRVLHWPTSRLLAAVAAIIVVGVTFALLHTGYRAMLENRVAVGTTDVRVSVLPFDAGGEADDPDVADRLTKEIKIRLAAVKGVVVVDSSQSEMAEIIGTVKGGTGLASADFVLRGSVERVTAEDGSHQVRAHAELFGSNQAKALWDQNFECYPRDVETLPAEIAEHVVAEMRQVTAAAGGE